MFVHLKRDNIAETLADDEEIKENLHFHWVERIVACRAIFIMVVFVLLYNCIYQQLGWYNKAMVFLGPILLVLLCFGVLNLYGFRNF